MNRTVVIVSPYFPPSNMAGVHRARHLAKHLPAAGWTPIVLCVHEKFHEQRPDMSLAQLVPADTAVIKVGALPIAATRCFGLGDISLRSWIQLRGSLLALLGSRPVDAVLITGAPYYPLLLAPMLKRRFGVPVVLDFQDPWVSKWGSEQHGWNKAHVSHRLAVLLEPRVVRSAAFITSVSETQNEEMAARYPWLDCSLMASIPIGGDSDDFDHLHDASRSVSDNLLSREYVNLSFVGTFMPRSEAVVRMLFQAFRRLRLHEPQLAARIKLNFVGTSNQPNDTSNYRVQSLAEEVGVADAVREVPQRLPYLEALGVIAHSNGLLLLGSDEPHYTASKIYPSLMSKRPYLALFHKASSAHAILSAAGGGIALAFSSMDELTCLEAVIAEGLRILVTAPTTLGLADPAAYAPYEGRVIARKYAEIFEMVSKLT